MFETNDHMATSYSYCLHLEQFPNISMVSHITEDCLSGCVFMDVECILKFHVK